MTLLYILPGEIIKYILYMGIIYLGSDIVRVAMSLHNDNIDKKVDDYYSHNNTVSRILV